MRIFEIDDNVTDLSFYLNKRKQNAGDKPSNDAQQIDFMKHRDIHNHKKRNQDDLIRTHYDKRPEHIIGKKEAIEEFDKIQAEFNKKCSFLATPTILKGFYHGANPLYAVMLTSSILGSKSDAVAKSTKVKFADRLLVENYDKIKEIITWYLTELRLGKKHIIDEFKPEFEYVITSSFDGEINYYKRELELLNEYMRRYHS